MSTIGYINVSLETFGGILSLIFILCLRIIRSHKTRMEQLYIHLPACNMILLFCDASAWLFKGKPDMVSFFIVRISNFLVYALGYVMVILFTHYLIGFLGEANVKVSKIPLYI